jgi:hypothetical protein
VFLFHIIPDFGAKLQNKAETPKRFWKIIVNRREGMERKEKMGIP